VIWGERDRYLPARFGAAYAERLPRAELLTVPGAGHWPWLERPELVDRVADFLS
jgi:pimeloyl-ACP methyl ester carboxylesterase